MPLERRSYSKSFKAQVIAECVQPDISIANVALTHNLNANLVHKWIRMHAQKKPGTANYLHPGQGSATDSRTASMLCLVILFLSLDRLLD
ncbi:transposase [Pseudomonas umsongensis]|uniref:transposase n=1 Tax=Pseudomonas umsongensis TaxID=198618 RepID=UPI001248239E|nr:transposase [Pseudomonas umsongensis]QFG30087.1 transposase [Pseudomonas umsongensis]